MRLVRLVIVAFFTASAAFSAFVGMHAAMSGDVPVMLVEAAFIGGNTAFVVANVLAMRRAA